MTPRHSAVKPVVFFLVLLTVALSVPAWPQEYRIQDQTPFPPQEFFSRLPARYQDQSGFLAKLSTLFSAYPGYCQGVALDSDGRVFVLMKNGERILFEDDQEKSFDQRLEDSDVEDMLAQDYPLGPPTAPFQDDFDPGRFRSDDFFKSVYGGSAEEVRSNLVKVNFCGLNVSFNRQNDAAKALTQVGIELQTLVEQKPGLKKYVTALGGTFNWRTIARTSRLSAHSWGIAIDLNPKLGAYWQWSKNRTGEAVIRMRLDYPAEFIEIFEKHGFIWGGKWSHFDLMHFEYRPELTAWSRMKNQGR